MKSKTYFSDFSKIQFRKQWWIMGLFAFALFMTLPVGFLIRVGNMEYAMNAWEYRKDCFNLFLLKSDGTMLIAMVGGVLTAFYQFRYLHSRRMVDFYHSLPVRREKLYLTKIIQAYLDFVIPLTAAILLCLLIGALRGLMTPEAVPMYFAGWLLIQVIYLIYYGACILGMMLTGRGFVGVLGTAAILFLPFFVSLINDMMHNQFFNTYAGYRSGYDFLTSISPGMVTAYLKSTVADVFEEFIGITAREGLQIALSLVYMVGFLALGYYMMIKRSSEDAGNSVAFSVPCRVYHVIISIVGALYCGMFFYSLANYNSLLWLYGGTLLGGLVLYLLIQFIYTIDIRKSFMYKWQLILVETVSLLIMALFYFDWIGFDLYIPEKENLYSVAISIPDGHYYQSYTVNGRFMDGEDYRMEYMNLPVSDDLYEMLADGIRTTDAYFGNRNGADVLVPYDSEEYSYVKVRYKLENGRTRDRVYRINLHKHKDLFVSLYGQAEFKNIMMPMYGMFPDNGKYEISLECEHEYRELFGDDVNEIRNFVNILKQSFEQMDGNTIVNEIPIATIHIYSEDLEHNYNLAVYPSNTELLAYLKACGYEIESNMIPEKILRIVIEDNRHLYGNSIGEDKDAPVDMTEEKSLIQEAYETIYTTYTDKVQIAEIIPALIVEDYRYDYLWVDSCSGIAAVVTYEGDDGYQHEMRCGLLNDKLPEFLK